MDTLIIRFKNIKEGNQRKDYEFTFPKEKAGQMAFSIMLAALSPTVEYVEVVGE